MLSKEFYELLKKEGKYKSIAEAKRASRAFVSAISIIMKRKEQYVLHGFGYFFTLRKKERKGKLPNGKEYFAKEKEVPMFRFSDAFKKKVSRKKGNK